MLGVLIIFAMFFMTFCIPALIAVWVIATLRGHQQTGRLAQRLEPTAHNGLVAGSSPAAPTH